jgi:hypothetical protein
MTKILFSNILYWKTTQVSIFSGPRISWLLQIKNCYLTPWKVSNYKKNFGKKFWHKKLFLLSKNWLRRMLSSHNRVFKLLPVTSRYNRTSDKKLKKSYLRVFYWLGCRNTFANILFCCQMAATKLMGPMGCSKKNLPKN